MMLDLLPGFFSGALGLVDQLPRRWTALVVREGHREGQASAANVHT
jgi:hypothetical protein